MASPYTTSTRSGDKMENGNRGCNEMKRLEGKVAIITGAASGIGAGAASLFAAEGASVIVADINGEGAEQCAAASRESGCAATAVRVDLGDPGSIQQMIDFTIETYGKLDVLFNNAAATDISNHSDFPIELTDITAWDDTMRINLRGTMLATKYAIPHLRTNGGGSIINTSSCSGQAGDLSRTAYGVSKAAIISLTQYTATQLGKEKIRCNAIAPGLIQTPAAKIFLDLQPEIGDILLSHNLSPRLGKTEDIAQMALFLASDASEYITGQVINVDGGSFSHQPFYADFQRLQSDQ